VEKQWKNNGKTTRPRAREHTPPDVEGIKVFLVNALSEHDLQVLKDPRRFVKMGISPEARRTQYFALRQAGHPAAAARRCRDWHIQSVLGQIDIQAVNYAYNHKEAL